MMIVSIDDNAKLGVVFGFNFGCQDIKEPLCVMVHPGIICLDDQQYAMYWVFIYVFPHFDDVFVVLLVPPLVTKP